MTGKKKRDDLAGEWFWVDRWMGSSAFGLSLEARGLYREMLSQSWLRGARLPADHASIRRLVAASEREWKRCWPLIEKFWTVEGDYLVNKVQQEVYAITRAKQKRATDRASKAAEARWEKELQKDVDAKRSSVA